MGRPVIGDVVVVLFPYADLSGSKRRPAVVVAHGDHGEMVLCQITSRSYAAGTTIGIDETSFQSGGLPRASFIRPAKLFTASPSLVVRTAGRLQPPVSRAVLAQLRVLFGA